MDKNLIEHLHKAFNSKECPSFIEKPTGRSALIGPTQEELVVKSSRKFFGDLAEAQGMKWIFESDSIDVNFDLPSRDDFAKFTKHLMPNHLPEIKQFHTDVLSVFYSGVLIVPLCNHKPILVFKNFGSAFESIKFRFTENNIRTVLSPYVIYANKKFSSDWPKMIYEEYTKDELDQARKGPNFYPEKFVELPLRMFIKPSVIRLSDKGVISHVKVALKNLELYYNVKGKNKSKSLRQIKRKKSVKQAVDELIKQGKIRKGMKRLPLKTLWFEIGGRSKSIPKKSTFRRDAITYLKSISYMN